MEYYIIHFFIENYYFIWVFFHNHSRITGLQGKGEGISLTPHYHFHPLYSRKYETGASSRSLSNFNAKQKTVNACKKFS